MNTFKLLSLIFFLSIATLQTSIAQKFGHMNSDLLLSELPEFKSATNQLKTFTAQKEKEIQNQNAALQKFYAETMAAFQKGTISPIQQQQKESELQQKQANLETAQQKAQQAITAKQEALLQPLFNKVDAAIKAVGKENNYDYIFNTNNGTIIHAKESEDVTALVKKKLGA